MSDIDTVVVGSLKALDPKRPIREADIATRSADFALGPKAAVAPSGICDRDVIAAGGRTEIPLISAAALM